jgi:hypothetical protein
VFVIAIAKRIVTGDLAVVIDMVEFEVCCLRVVELVIVLIPTLLLFILVLAFLQRLPANACPSVFGS